MTNQGSYLSAANRRYNWVAMKELPTLLLDGSDVDITWLSLVKAALSDRQDLPTSAAESSQLVIPGGIRGEELYVRLTSAPWKEHEKIFAARNYAGPQNTIVLFVPSEPLEEVERTGWMRNSIRQALLNAFQSIQTGSPDIVLEHGGHVSLVDVKSIMPSPIFEIYFHPDLSTEQIEKSFAALADYYRACGGTGLRVQFEEQDVRVPEVAYDGR
jgi:hypothetical protein